MKKSGFVLTSDVLVKENSVNPNLIRYLTNFVAFCSFFPCSLTVVHRGRQWKSGVDNEKALVLTNSTVFHRGRQWKSSRAGQQNIFFIFQPDFNTTQKCNKISCCIVHAKHFGWNSIFHCLKMNQYWTFQGIFSSNFKKNFLDWLNLQTTTRKSCWQPEMSGWIQTIMQQNTIVKAYSLFSLFLYKIKSIKLKSRLLYW